MAADLTLLVPAFRPRLETLLAHCRARGVEMRPYMGLRTPLEQARLWRQSRSREQIDAKVAQLRAAGADYLADCIVNVGPQNGDPVTNAVPGLSWHQWGEAADCFWVVKGSAEWSTKRLFNGLNGYRVMAEEAKRLGLDPGGLWRKFPDWPHVQLRPEPSSLGRMSLKDISEEMKRRFKR